MSSSSHLHPIIRDLRTDISALRSSSSSSPTSYKIKDSDPHVPSFCRSLEAAFAHGSAGFFFAVEALAEEEERRDQGMNALVRHVVGQIKKIRSLRTDVGRGRYFLRCCLNHGWTGSLVMSLRTWKDSDRFYRSDSLLLRDPKDSLMEILPPLQLLHFDLCLPNRAFLDSAGGGGWDLPRYRRLELVPCADLGLMVCSLEGRIVVSKVKVGSVAGEDGKVGLGDVIDEVDGVETFGMPPEQVAQVVKRCSRRPISLCVVKAEGRGGKVYPPLTHLLQGAGLCPAELEAEWERRRLKRVRKKEEGSLLGANDGEDEFDPLLDDEEEEEEEEERRRRQGRLLTGHELLYVGSLKVGQVGDSCMLDKTINRIRGDQKKVHHSVTLQVQELGVKLYSNGSGKLVLDYTYPEISACGCSTANCRYLAFIAGDNVCQFATEFMCHVFYCANEARAKSIVTAIAEGFQRMRNAV